MSSADIILGDLHGGDRCPKCHRRVPKPRTGDSPPTKRVVAVLPTDRAEWVLEHMEILQEYVEADPESYPRGTLLEVLLVIGAQQREELRKYFRARVEL